ncbi:MAG: histidine--tRNA ligase [Gammaproteobacteria bacterium]|nr:histidine--tRNA ligase [Gammaproteobacteria bacterium]
MSDRIQSIRGMHDVLPPSSRMLRDLEHSLQDVLRQYGYLEVRLPVLEQTELFRRSLGEVTDVVEKEMYTFEDRNGDSLTLRPEGTAGCVRAGLQQGILHGQPVRLWYGGPFFRHERPQKGRYRQFHQIGAETFGLAGPDIDAELMVMCQQMWQRIGLPTGPVLEINSLGTLQARQSYRATLTEYLKQHESRLGTQEQQRLHTNPMRILDSKNPDIQDVIRNAPSLSEHLDPESSEHFEGLKALLHTAGIQYHVNPQLVRGLDYYSKTVFEWVVPELGAQATICAGGRYDGLVDQLGGKPYPAAGFAIGLERLMSLLEASWADDTGIDAYMVLAGDQASHEGMRIAGRLRKQLPSLSLIVNCGGGSMKAQMKRADRSMAKLALILAEEELNCGTISVKFLREQRDQETVSQENLVSYLDKQLCTEGPKS